MRTFYFITVFSFFIVLLNAEETIYLDISTLPDKEYRITKSGKYIVTGKKNGDEFRIGIHGQAKIDMTLENVEIKCNNSAPINIESGHLTLTLKGEINRLTSSSTCGLAVPIGSTLTFSEKSNGSEIRIVGTNGDGIGHSIDFNQTGDITINGGTIGAFSNDKSGAGINGRNIIINGGKIHTEGRCGINCKYEFKINGGTLFGTSPESSIEVITSRKYLYGGSIESKDNKWGAENVIQRIVETGFPDIKVTKLSYSGEESLGTYGQNDLFTDSAGKLYLWLEDNGKEIVAKSFAYRVRFDTGDATPVNTLWLEDGTYNIELLEIEEPQRPYFEFDGWMDALNSPLKTITVDGKSLTLYARWKPNPIIVKEDKCSFSCMIGEFVDIDLSTIFSDQDDSGSKEFFQIDELPPGISLDNGRLTGKVDESDTYKFKVSIRSENHMEETVEITFEVEDRFCEISGASHNNYYRDRICLVPKGNGTISQVGYSYEILENYPMIWHDLSADVEIEDVKEGNNTLYYWIKDKTTGHIFPEPKSLTFLYDSESPELIKTPGIDFIELSIQDVTSGIDALTYTLDGKKSTIPINGEKEFKQKIYISPGTHTFSCSVVDMAGNKSEIVSESAECPDDVSCVISGTINENGYCKDEKIYLNLQNTAAGAADIFRVAYSLKDIDDIPQDLHDIDQKGIEIEGLVEGENTIYFWVLHKNTDYKSPRNSITFNRDTKSPELDIKTENNYVLLNFKDHTSGLQAIYFTINGREESIPLPPDKEKVFEHEYKIHLSPGKHPIRFNIIDMAGNMTVMDETVSIPEPESSYSINLSGLVELEGVTFDQWFDGTLYVNEGDDFSFRLILDPEYSESEPVVCVNGEEIEPYQSPLRSNLVYAYRIRNIRSDIKIEISGIKKNEDPSVGNEQIAENELIIRTMPGQLQMETASEIHVQITDMNGKVLFKRNLNGSVNLPLPVGVYNVTTHKGTRKVLIAR